MEKGLEAQLTACRSYAARENTALAGVFSDRSPNGAGGLPGRQALLEVLSRLERGDCLLVAERECLDDDPIRLAMIERAVSGKGARIATVFARATEGDDPSKALRRRLVDAFAEYESFLNEEKTREAQQDRRRRYELVEIRQRLWKSSWFPFLEAVSRLDGVESPRGSGVDRIRPMGGRSGRKRKRVRRNSGRPKCFGGRK